MAKRRRSLASISQEQAYQALTFLVHEGKLALGSVEKALQNRKRIIRELQDRLAALGMEAGDLVRRSVKDGPFPMFAAVRRKGTGSKSSKPRRRKRVSAQVRKTRQAQGRYLGAIRRLSKGDRKRIKTIREKSGVNAAISAAHKMAK